MIALLLFVPLRVQPELEDPGWVTLRTEAAERLAADPDDLTAHAQLGEALWRVEADHAQAWRHLRQAAETDDDALHQQVTANLARLAGEMGDATAELAWWDAHDLRHDPDTVAERAWALYGVGRVDEAREHAAAGIASSDPWQRTLGHGAACHIELSEARRSAARAVCDAALDHHRNAQTTDHAVVALNAAAAAAASFDLPTAERLAREAAAEGWRDPAVNPWPFLAQLLLDQGRGIEAVDALGHAAQWAHGRRSAALDAAVAQVLLVAGRPHPARKRIDRAIQQPDRGVDARGNHLALRIALRQVQSEKDAERAAAEGRYPRPRPDPGDWADRAALVGLLADVDTLRRTVRGRAGGLDLPPWRIGELVPIVGPGVMQAALRFARAREAEAWTPYGDAIEAEIHWTGGRHAKALELARSALEHLPAEERLLVGRVSAIAADAAERLGEPDALSLYERALQRDPSIIRRLGLSLPVRIEAADGAERLGELLADSPRLRPGESGFIVRVDSSLGVCLRSPNDARIACSEGPGAGDVRTVTAALAFHDEAFALPLGSDGLDRASLDSATAIDARAERARIDQVLEALR